MHKELLIRDFKVDEEKVLPLGMGYEEEYFQDLQPFPLQFLRKPVIGFVGSMYYGYDYTVESLLHCLKDLEREGFQFTLLALGDSCKIFSRYAERENLSSFLPISRVDYSTALRLMMRLDFGLILSPQAYRLIVNSKLWEYMRSDLSVLAIVPAESMAAKIVEESGCGYILPYEKEPMLCELKRALVDYSEGRARRAELLRRSCRRERSQSGPTCRWTRGLGF